MIKKIQHNSLFIALTFSLCVSTYLLNFCTAIYQCAMVFTLMALIANISTSFYGKNKAICALVFAVIVSIFLQWDMQYYIKSVLFNGLVFASLTSSLISIYWSTNIYKALGSKMGLCVANIISISSAAIIDGLIMGSYFAINNNVSFFRILEIFSKEVGYKIIFAIIASFVIQLSIVYIVLRKSQRDRKNLTRQILVLNI